MPPRSKSKIPKTAATLYELLNVSADASQKEITKAFRVKALILHPDKRPDDASATESFQALVAAHDILKDPKRRKTYDETGCTDEESASFSRAYDDFRAFFAKVTPEDIDSFAKTYKGSTEEEEDVISFYNKQSGDISQLLEWIPLSQPDEVERFIAMVKSLIKRKKIEDTDLLNASIGKLRKAAQKYEKKQKKEAAELDSEKKSNKSRSNSAATQQSEEASLILALKANRNKRALEASSFLENLASKYGSSNAKGSSNTNSKSRKKQKG